MAASLLSDPGAVGPMDGRGTADLPCRPGARTGRRPLTRATCAVVLQDERDWLEMLVGHGS